MTADFRRIASYAASFFVITSVTVSLSRIGGGLALVWLGGAVGAAMFTQLPQKLWKFGFVAIFCASALATSLFGFGPRPALPFALVNATEAWLIARLLVFVRPQGDSLDRLDSLGLVVVIVAAAPAIMAIPGGLIASFFAPGPWYQHAASWWAAHALGTLIALPLALLITQIRVRNMRQRWARREIIELAGHCVLIAAVAMLAVGQNTLPLMFLPVVPMLLAAFRCRREGAILGTIIVSGAIIYALANQLSPVELTGMSPKGKVLFLQFYLAMISLLAVPVSVALRQHELVVNELKENKALSGLIADHSNDAMLNLDPQGSIRYASPAGNRLSGLADLEGQPLAVFFDPLDEGLVRDLLAQAAGAAGETCSLERPVVCGDEQLWLEAKACAVDHGVPGKPAALQGFAVTIRDVTARKQTELAAIHAAETDPLTGLPNRRALLRRLEQGLNHAEQRPFALAIVDLDHFKAINDTHGHLAGDATLREVAGVMRRLSNSDRFFARLGGEEFALIAAQSDFSQNIALCERLRKDVSALALESPSGTKFRVTASIGLARLDRRHTAAQALEAADGLLYRAKDGGRNRVEASAAQLLVRGPNRRAA